jgi:hypothetical protein
MNNIKDINFCNPEFEQSRMFDIVQKIYPIGQKKLEIFMSIFAKIATIIRTALIR